MADNRVADAKARIHSLLDDLEKIEFGMDAELDAFRRRGAMILRRTFPPATGYTNQFLRIAFKTDALLFQEGAYQEFWEAGKDYMMNFLNTLIEELDEFGLPADPDGLTGALPEIAFNRIFIAHGHDDQLLNEVRAFVATLDITPVVLKDLPSRGRTVIEKFEDYADVPAAIILLTPDEYSYSRSEEPEAARLQPRQNPILELGYFMGKIKRSNVIAVHKAEEDFVFPSDIQGVIYVPYESDEKWKKLVARELRDIGYEIDIAKFLSA